MKTALAFVVPLALYVSSAYHGVTYWDVGELDTVAWIFGIAHPTAFPAYVVIAWLFTHLVPVGSVAFRASLFSACAMSVAAWCIARTAIDESADVWCATLTAWLFAAGIVVWSHATRAEVHALAAATLSLQLLYGVRWYRSKRPRDLYAAALAFGVGVAVHPVVLLTLPAALVLLTARMHETPSRVVLRAIAVAVCASAVWYAYLPLRSAYVSVHALDPTRALGLAPGRAFWDYDHPATVNGFVTLVTGAEFDVAGGLRAIGTDAGALPSYLRTLLAEFTLPAVALLLWGIVVAWRRDRILAAMFLAGAGVSVLFGLGYSEESDAARYDIPSFIVGALFVVIGASSLRRRWCSLTVRVVLAGSVVWLLFAGRVLFGQPHDVRAQTEVSEVVRATPDNAVLIATWVLAPPLAYTAYVDRALGHRIVDAAWVGDDADSLGVWLRTRPIFVVGKPLGSISGFRLERMPTHTELYRVERE